MRIADAGAVEVGDRPALAVTSICDGTRSPWQKAGAAGGSSGAARGLRRSRAPPRLLRQHEGDPLARRRAAREARCAGSSAGMPGTFAACIARWSAPAWRMRSASRISSEVVALDGGLRVPRAPCVGRDRRWHREAGAAVAERAMHRAHQPPRLRRPVRALDLDDGAIGPGGAAAQRHVAQDGAGKAGERRQLRVLRELQPRRAVAAWRGSRASWRGSRPARCAAATSTRGAARARRSDRAAA